MKRLIVYGSNVLEVVRDNGVADAQLRSLEIAIMRGDGATVTGTGGLRKIRCASEHRGKSGSIRILFADYPLIGRTYLLAAFGKNDKANLNKAEVKELANTKKMFDKAVERLIQNAKQN